MNTTCDDYKELVINIDASKCFQVFVKTEYGVMTSPTPN
jgi:hypothetical protein